MQSAMSEMQWLQTFSDKLRVELKGCDMTQKQLSEETGISSSTINSYLQKQRMPSIISVLKICDALGVDVDSMTNF